MRTRACTLSFAPFLAAMLAATAVTSALSPAAAEKLPSAFLGEWCQIGGTGKVTGGPAHWTYRRGRCPSPHYRLTVRSNGMTDGGQLCRLVDTFEGSKTALVKCGSQTRTANYWLSLTTGGRLQKLMAQP